MSNSISFIGRLGADAELKDVGQNSVLEFRVASDTGFGDRKVTNWFRCALWGRRGQSLQAHMNKGKQVFVTGELTMRKYTDRDGVERFSSDVNVNQVEFISGGDRGGEGNSYRESSSSEEGSTARAPAQSTPETEDDMPF